MPRLLLGALVLTLAPAAGLPPAPADSRKEAPAFKPSEQEKALLELLNKARAKEKLPALESNPLLYKIARAHSANMAKQRKMTHVLDGKRVKDRALGAGYDYKFIGENVAFSETDKDDVVPLADIHEGWMKSKAHRDNILAERFREVGLGLARNAKGETYYTQVFGTLRKTP
jgi:uncharacterized protein YkwD